MKLPGVAIVTAFAAGIARGQNLEIARRSNSHRFVALLLCSAAASLLIGNLFHMALASDCLLVAKPSALGDSSFQLSFWRSDALADWHCPWLQATVQPYGRALREGRDVTMLMDTSARNCRND